MRRGGQGEALTVWVVWLVTLFAVVLTYSRIDAAQLYNVQGNGLRLGLSRAAVHTNWPSALVAMVLVLVALPGDICVGQEHLRTPDGQLEAAVHLGEHHGWHGALMLLPALLLSRVQAVGRLRIWLVIGMSILAAYGAVNAA